MFEIFNNIQLTKNFQHITSVESNFRCLIQAQIVKFLARVGSKHKFNGPRLARLEKKLARLGPGQKKWARYTSNRHDILFRNPQDMEISKMIWKYAWHIVPLLTHFLHLDSNVKNFSF